MNASDFSDRFANITQRASNGETRCAGRAGENPKDHPAAEYLKHRNFLAGREFPPEFATSAEFYPTLIATFKAAMPLIRFLNAPLIAGSER